MKRPLAALAAACLIGSLAAAVPLASSSAEAATKSISAKVLLSKLSVRAEDHSKKFQRIRFGYDKGLDADRDGCITRKEVLIRDAVKVTKVSPSCAVYGKWKSLYDNKITTDPNKLQIDHLVPLAEAWYSGAGSWSRKKQVAFGNDLGYKWDLQAVTASANQKKGAGDPADWMPKKNRCTYVKAWIGVKYRWKLSIDSREKAALKHSLAKCDSLSVLKPGVPNLTALVSKTGTPAPAPAPAPVTAPAPAPTPSLMCPTGTVTGDITSITPDTYKSDSYFEYFDASGYVRNNSNASVDVGSITPAITFYTASGMQVDYTYGDWDLSDLRVSEYGGYTLPPGATITWHKRDGIMARSDWIASSFATGNAISPFNASWSDGSKYSCPSPNQPSNTRTQFSIIH